MKKFLFLLGLMSVPVLSHASTLEIESFPQEIKSRLTSEGAFPVLNATFKAVGDDVTLNSVWVVLTTDTPTEYKAISVYNKTQKVRVAVVAPEVVGNYAKLSFDKPIKIKSGKTLELGILGDTYLNRVNPDTVFQVVHANTSADNGIIDGVESEFMDKDLKNENSYTVYISQKGVLSFSTKDDPFNLIKWQDQAVPDLVEVEIEAVNSEAVEESVSEPIEVSAQSKTKMSIQERLKMIRAKKKSKSENVQEMEITEITETTEVENTEEIETPKKLSRREQIKLLLEKRRQAK